MNLPTHLLDVKVEDDARQPVLSVLAEELRRRPDLVAQAPAVAISVARLLLPAFLARRLEDEIAEMGEWAVELFTLRLLVRQGAASDRSDPFAAPDDHLIDRLVALLGDLRDLPDPQVKCDVVAASLLDELLEEGVRRWPECDLLAWLAAQPIASPSAGSAVLIAAVGAALVRVLASRPTQWGWGGTVVAAESRGASGGDGGAFGVACGGGLDTALSSECPAEGGRAVAVLAPRLRLCCRRSRSPSCQSSFSEHEAPTLVRPTRQATSLAETSPCSTASRRRSSARYRMSGERTELINALRRVVEEIGATGRCRVGSSRKER